MSRRTAENPLLAKVKLTAYPSKNKPLFTALTDRTYANLVAHTEATTNLVANKKKVTILSLGCGFGLDFFALKRFFNEREIEVSYIGVDNHGPSIAAACAMFGDFDDARFICCDASDPNNLAHMNDQSIDLVVMQHPYFLDCNPQWKGAFTNMVTAIIPRVLKTEGNIYAAFYHLEEYRYFLDMKINGGKPFRFRQDTCIDHSKGGLTLCEPSGLKVIPEQYTYITRSPVNFQLAGAASSAGVQQSAVPNNGTACCWAGLFAAGAVAAAGAIAHYYSSYSA